jgi:hypothetical protein
MTGMLPIGSTSMTPSFGRLQRLLEVHVAGEAGRPLIARPQEPQIAARQEQRMPIEPSWRSLACRMPVEHGAVPVEVDREVLPVRGLPDSGE